MAHRHGGGEGHQERDDLTGEHRIGDAGQIVLACLFAAIWIADTVVFKYTTFLNQYIPSGIRIPIGVILFVLSAYLAKTGLSIVFGEKREEPVVIRKSVFGIVRHPVYLAEILLYLGFLVLTISVAALQCGLLGFSSCTISRVTRKGCCSLASAKITSSTCGKCQCGYRGCEGEGSMGNSETCNV